MIWTAIPAAGASAYYLIALAGAIRARRARTLTQPYGGPVSILKPVRGRDPGFHAAILSHAVQDYPEFEILFGVAREDDPAIQDIRKLIGKFPNRNIRIIHSTASAANGKVGVLIDLAAAARYPALLVNDSDICVPPGYLRDVMAPLGDPRTGVVTCLYRAKGQSAASRWESIGVSTEFAPSVLAARLLGVSGFALGSTLAFRAAQLRDIGGFEVMRDFIADDYQLGSRIRSLGYGVEFAPVVVETDLGGESWRRSWRHQVRWSRTIRVSRPAGYLGYVVTHATLWSLVALMGGHAAVCAACLGVRLIAGLAAGVGVLGDRKLLLWFPLIPLRDLWGFAVWLWGLAGSKVEWRGNQYRLFSDGRIQLEGKNRVSGA